MHDTERGAVRIAGAVGGVQTAQGPDQDRARDPRRDPLVAIARGAQQPREVLSLHVLHHQEDLALGGDYVQGGHHVRAPDPRGDARFVEEHGDELRILREHAGAAA